MNIVRIFRHVASEGPGYLADVLDKHNIPYEIIAIDEGTDVPTELDNIAGLVFMGGNMSVNDDLPWIADELALIRKAANKGLPMLGHCLGGQLISKALGGSITKSPVKEIGWHPVSALDNGPARQWLPDFTQDTELFHWHGETFSIPNGATAILESELCPHQAFVLDNILALQCHVEMKTDMVPEWAQLYSYELEENSPAIQSATKMIENLEARIATMQKVADRLYEKWLEPVMRGVN